MLIVTLTAACAIALCEEPSAKKSYPLWDGSQSVADYAKRVNLPATMTLELGNGVKMELVLIPAGKFIMGTPEPTPVDEEGFRTKIVTGQALLTVSVTALLVMLAVVIARAVRKKRRPQLSLGLLLLMTVAAGGCVLSGLHWHRSVRKLEEARIEYQAAKARFDSAEQLFEKPALMTLTKPFYMEKFLVTQEQYQQVMSANPSTFRSGKDNPVENVSWNDAQEFCKRAIALISDSSTPDRERNCSIRLPTEAEWEFSCRAGTTTTYYSGDTMEDLDRIAWHYGNSNHTTHPVGQKEPNAFGLYDMQSNIWQWCQDCRSAYFQYRAKVPTIDPQGPASGTDRVLRGGSWGNDSLRSSFELEPDSRHEYTGFRVAMTASALP